MIGDTTNEQNRAEKEFRGFLKMLSKVAGQVLSPQQNSFEIDGVSVQVDHHDWNTFHCISMTFQLNACEVQGEETLTSLLEDNRSLSQTNPLPSLYALSPCRKHVQLIQRLQPGDLPLWALEQYIFATVRQLQRNFVGLLVPK